MRGGIKTALAGFVMVLSLNVANAQEDGSRSRNRDDFRFGLKVGANYANVYDERGENFVADPKIGVAGGAFMYIPIVRFIGFQPEVLYAQKGFRGSGSADGGNYTLVRTTSHIDVPLMLALRLPVVTFVAGPQYSFLVHQRDNFTSNNMSINIEQQFENNDLRKNTLGLVGGVDITLLKFVISGRAGWDVQSNNGDGTSTNPDYKNVWLQGTVGIHL
jgi:hypothetical protein